MENEKYGIELELLIGKFKQKMQEVKSAFKGIENKKVNINANTSQIDYLKYQISEITEKLQNTSKFGLKTADIVKYRAQLERLTNQYNKLIGKQNEVSVTSKKMNTDMSKSFSKMTSKIRRFGLSLLSLRSIYSLISRASSAYLAQDTQLANKLQSVWAGLGSLLAPIIEGIVNILAKAVKYIAIFIKALTGVDLLARASAKSMKGAAGSAKALNKALAGFDELQNLDTDAGGGGGDLGAGLGGLEDVAINMALVEKLKTAFTQLKEILRQVWESAPVQAFVDFATTYGQFLFDYWSSLGSNLWENLKMTWENISGDVGIALDNMSLLWTTFWSDLSTGIQTWGQPIINGVTKIFNSIWKDAIDPAIKIITKAWADFSQILLDLWNQYGKPLVDNIGEFVTTTIALFQKIWDDVLKPIVQPFLETLSWLWNEHIKDVVKNIGEFIGKLVNGALEIYNKFIAPIIMWLIDKLSPAWSFLSNLIVGVLGTALAFISTVVGSIFKILGGIIDFITGVFTGNWKKAWEGVKSIFAGIMRSLGALVEAPINLLIDGINSFISGLNKIKIPDWVPGIGGKGFNIKKIPKLEVGTNYVPEDQLAMIHKGEAVVPKKFNSREYFGGSDETNALLQELINRVENIEINPYTTIKDVGKASLNYINNKSRQLGESVVY